MIKFYDLSLIRNYFTYSRQEGSLNILIYVVCFPNSSFVGEGLPKRNRETSIILTYSYIFSN